MPVYKHPLLCWVVKLSLYNGELARTISPTGSFSAKNLHHELAIRLSCTPNAIGIVLSLSTD